MSQIKYSDFWTKTEQVVLTFSIFVTCIASMLGSLITMFTFIICKKTRSNLRFLLCCLSITDLITAVGNLIIINEVDFCEYQSYATSISSMSSFLWTICLAFYFYVSLEHKSLITNSQKTKYLFIVFHTISWGIPILLGSIGLLFDVFGDDFFTARVGWCWIKPGNQIRFPMFSDKKFRNIFWLFIEGKAIEIIAFIVTPILYIQSRRKLQQELNKVSQYLTEEVQQSLQQTDIKLILVPVVFFLGRVWGILRFFFHIFGWGFQDFYGLALLQGIGDCSQGWGNFILFCLFTKSIREEFTQNIYHYVRKCLNIPKTDISHL